MTVRIRTTGRPWEDLEVSEQEARDLHRQGLLVEDQPRQSAKPGEPTSKTDDQNK
jgi:hypothetical protein